MSTTVTIQKILKKELDVYLMFICCKYFVVPSSYVSYVPFQPPSVVRILASTC